MINANRAAINANKVKETRTRTCVSTFACVRNAWRVTFILVCVHSRTLGFGASACLAGDKNRSICSTPEYRLKKQIFDDIDYKMYVQIEDKSNDKNYPHTPVIFSSQALNSTPVKMRWRSWERQQVQTACLMFREAVVSLLTKGGLNNVPRFYSITTASSFE